MRKQAFTIIEVVVVFLLILGITFFILPKSLNSTKQARFISRWTEQYSQLEYIFSVIKAQNGSIIKTSLVNAKNNEERKNIVLNILKPYLRINSEIKPNIYKQYYMDKALVKSGDRYYFENFYLTDLKEIISLKWLNSKCKKEETCAIMSFDLNGLEPPNTWGYDIFGINLLQDGIEPLGKNMDADTLKSNCSKYGFGVYCSYYYLIGGEFDN